MNTMTMLLAALLLLASMATKVAAWEVLPAPATPFLDSLARRAAQRIQPPAKPVTQAADAGDEPATADQTAPTITAAEQDAGGESKTFAVQHSTARVEQLSPSQPNPIVETPAPLFTRGVLASFRLQCGHEAEFHIGRNGDPHVVLKHGRGWRREEVRTVFSRDGLPGVPVVHFPNGATLCFNSQRGKYELVLP